MVLSKEKPIPYQPPLPPNEAPSGVDAAAGVTPVGLRPPFVTPAAAHSHPDCRGIPILIVALHPAAAQIEEKDGVCHVVMAHHPFNWLKNKKAFEDRCNKVAKIQLFGHEHTRRVEEAKRHLRIRAGAMHPDRDEPDWNPGYNWIDISVDGAGAERELVVRLWVRQYDIDNFLAIPDPDGELAWENRYDLPRWSAPESLKTEDKKTEVTTGEATVQVPESQTMQAAAPVSIRSVTIKFFKLKEHEQRRLISYMKLDKSGDRDLKDYELVIAAVKRSDEQGLLTELDRLIDETLAGGTF